MHTKIILPNVSVKECERFLARWKFINSDGYVIKPEMEIVGSHTELFFDNVCDDQCYSGGVAPHYLPCLPDILEVNEFATALIKRQLKFDFISEGLLARALSANSDVVDIGILFEKFDGEHLDGSAKTTLRDLGILKDRSLCEVFYESFGSCDLTIRANQFSDIDFEEAENEDELIEMIEEELIYNFKISENEVSSLIENRLSSHAFESILGENFVHPGFVDFFHWWNEVLSIDEKLRFQNRFGALSGYSIDRSSLHGKTTNLEDSIREFSNVITPCWVDYDANVVSRWALIFNNSEETRDISYRLLEYAETLADKSTAIDDHYYFQNRIQVYYRWRKIDEFALENAIYACKVSTKIAELVATEINFKGESLPEHYGYKQLSIIEEKAGNLSKALELCKLAEDQGWSGDWEKRSLRIKKKLGVIS